MKLLSFLLFLIPILAKGQTATYHLPERGVCAHRGAMTSHPENTLPAFEAAIECGAHMIEFDVQLSKDGELVIMHDSKVERTTDGAGQVSEMTFEELRQLDAGSWKGAEFNGLKIPTLQEVLSIMPKNIWLNIHLKGGAEVGEKVALAVAEEKRLHQAVVAATMEAVSAAREAVPEILICNMERQSGAWDYVDGTIAIQADFIQLNGGIKPEFREYAEKLKAEGIKINYFGTDDAIELGTLWEYGVDFPLVNDIQAAIQVAKKEGIAPVSPVFNP